MTKETHTKGGCILGLVLLPYINEYLLNDFSNIYKFVLIIIYLYFSYLGSLFPDIDLKNSYISKVFPKLYKHFGKRFKHRGFTHSLIALLILDTLSKYLIILSGNNIVFYVSSGGFIIGYVSHLFLDLLTKEGIEIFYPISINLSLFPIKTGSKIEKNIYKLLNFLFIFLLGYRFYILL